jgi:hypothetical protein
LTLGASCGKTLKASSMELDKGYIKFFDILPNKREVICASYSSIFLVFKLLIHENYTTLAWKHNQHTEQVISLKKCKLRKACGFRWMGQTNCRCINNQWRNTDKVYQLFF